ncbi:MAG: hydrogen gas-evolving membrane-bound hydrogenase subunit E [Chloroflexota bacterium]
MKKWLAAVFTGMLSLTLLYAACIMPPMGEPDNPSAQNIVPHYLEYGVEEAGAENIVTCIILNYRGYDTLGEVTVLFCAVTAVLAVLSRKKKGLAASIPENPTGVAPSAIILTAVRIMVPFILLFSVYTILHGNVSPGGGFQGGAIIGASLIIFTSLFGLNEAEKRIPERIRIPLEDAPVIAFLVVGVSGVFFGTNFLTYLLPGIPVPFQTAVRTFMLLLVGVGIGTGVAMEFISILFALLKEE